MGRCCFAKQAVAEGDTVFVERALIVAVRSRYQVLWKQLNKAKRLSTDTFEWHFAALVSFALKQEMKITFETLLDLYSNESALPNFRNLDEEIDVIQDMLYREGLIPEGYSRAEHKQLMSVFHQNGYAADPRPGKAAGQIVFYNTSLLAR